MRNNLGLVFVLAGVVTAVAQEPDNKGEPAPDWPKKGDTVYISATLVNVAVGVVVGPLITGPHEGEVPACVPMIIKKANPRSEVWITKDPIGLRESPPCQYE